MSWPRVDKWSALPRPGLRSSKQDTLLHALGWSKGDARVRPEGSEETGVRWAPGGSVGAEPLWRVRISKRK